MDGTRLRGESRLRRMDASNLSSGTAANVARASSRSPGLAIANGMLAATPLLGVRRLPWDMCWCGRWSKCLERSPAKRKRSASIKRFEDDGIGGGIEPFACRKTVRRKALERGSARERIRIDLAASLDDYARFAPRAVRLQSNTRAHFKLLLHCDENVMVANAESS